MGYKDNIGHFGIGERNNQSRSILDFSSRNGQKMMNTCFKHRESHKYNWYGCDRALCDYDRKAMADLFLTKNARTVTHVKAVQSVALDSDHWLVVMKTKLLPCKTRPRIKVKKVNHSNMNYTPTS